MMRCFGTKNNRNHLVGLLTSRDVEAEAKAGSGPFSAEARKVYRFRFHIGYLI